MFVRFAGGVAFRLQEILEDLEFLGPVTRMAIA